MCVLKNSRSLRNLREPVKEKAARAPYVNCAGALRPPSVKAASPCWAAAGSRTRRTFGSRRSEAPGPVRWAREVCAHAGSVRPRPRSFSVRNFCRLHGNLPRPGRGQRPGKMVFLPGLRTQLLAFGVPVSPSCWDVPWS